MPPILRVSALREHYGQVRAVDGISFSVEAGTISALLGPNGAGKTTTVEIIEGLRTPDSGEIELFAVNLRKTVPPELRARMGVMLQEGGFEPDLRVREVLTLFASFFPRTLPKEELLEVVGLKEKARALVRTLSGGRRSAWPLRLPSSTPPSS